MKFLVAVTPPYIYHSCFTRKTFSEENFTGKQDLFHSLNMKNWGRRKVRKHKEIRASDKCVTLNISAKFDSLNKMETTSSESKGKLGRSGKGLVTALARKTKLRSKNTKRQGMPSEMSTWRTFPTLSKSLKNCQGTLCEKGSPNMSQLQDTII